MSDICLGSFDDQQKLNCGLKGLGIRWLNNNSDYQTTTVHGITENTLTVSILPYNDICRQLTCDSTTKGGLYIWHKGGHRNKDDKLKSAEDGGLWFLHHKWSSIDSDYTGVEWLESLSHDNTQ